MKMRKPLYLILLVFGVQGFLFENFIRNWHSAWHEPIYRVEIAEVLDWMRTNLQDDGAVAGDFVTSTEVLAHTRHPIILQPKYETRRSRERIEEFINGLFHSSPEDFRRLLVDKYRCRYLLSYRRQLWSWRYKAGLPFSAREPPAGSAAHGLITLHPDEFEKVPGYKLLYRSPFRTDWLRLYRIE